MLCLRARRLISAFHDKELAPETARRVAAHIERCPRCFLELQRVKRGAELASIYCPAAPTETAGSLRSPPVEAERSPAPSRQIRLVLTAVLAVLVLAAGVLFRSPLHNALWRSASEAGGCVLDLGGRSRDGRVDALELFRARYSGHFHEVPFEGEPGREWAGFDYMFPSRVPPRMRLKSVMLFDSVCCGGLGLVFADGRRNLCLLQQPSDRPMSLAGLALDPERICRYTAAHAAVGRYSVHTWRADNLQYVLLSDLTHGEIEATIASLRYVR